MIRILVLNSDTDGVGYFRMLNPHLCLDDPEIKIDIRLLSDGTLPLLNKNFLKHYNIIVFNKMIPFQDVEKDKIFYSIVKEFSIKLLYDIDDYWILNNSHINYKNWVKNKSSEKIENMLKTADVVTTTTQIFADRIRRLNSNVVVIPNAINITEQQWVPKKILSDKIRFIWGGGISHQVDLKLIKDDFKTFDNNFLNKVQMIMCGYDLRIKMHDGKINKDDQRRSQWGKFESIFNNNGKYIKTMEYREYLNKTDNFNHDDTYGFKEEYLDEFYQRRHTKPILLYGTMYNEADISIAPLKNNHQFNLMKSQLKLIESGAHGIPIIQSNYGPYTIDNIEKNGLGLYVNEGKDSWAKKMNFYVENPSAIKEHGQANHEYFLKNFEMKVVNQKRIDLYKEVYNQDRGNVKI